MFSVGGNADGTDLTETHGFFNCVENLRMTTDFLAAARPFRLYGGTFAAIIGVTWSDADDISNNETMKQFSNETI
jgi:hypothetical protein